MPRRCRGIITVSARVDRVAKGGLSDSLMQGRIALQISQLQIRPELAQRLHSGSDQIRFTVLAHIIRSEDSP